MNNKQILNIILHFLSALEADISEVKEHICRIQGNEFNNGVSEQPYEKLFWADGQGLKGSYQLASKRNNGNSNLFRHLQAVLKQNNWRFTEKSWRHFYWLGKEGDAIFRRLKKQS